MKTKVAKIETCSRCPQRDIGRDEYGRVIKDKKQGACYPDPFVEIKNAFAEYYYEGQNMPIFVVPPSDEEKEKEK